jgi:hypothetical protein
MDLKEFLSWIPGWLGFLALIVVGVLMAVHGIFNPLGAALGHSARLGFILFGLCAAVVGAASWIIGGTSQIKGREGVVGVKVSLGDLPWWGYLVDAGVIALAVILYLALKS